MDRYSYYKITLDSLSNISNEKNKKELTNIASCVAVIQFAGLFQKDSMKDVKDKPDVKIQKARLQLFYKILFDLNKKAENLEGYDKFNFEDNENYFAKKYSESLVKLDIDSRMDAIIRDSIQCSTVVDVDLAKELNTIEIKFKYIN